MVFLTVPHSHPLISFTFSGVSVTGSSVRSEEKECEYSHTVCAVFTAAWGPLGESTELRDSCSWYCPVWPCRSCQRSASPFKLLLKCRLLSSSPPHYPACILGITIPELLYGIHFCIWVDSRLAMETCRCCCQNWKEPVQCLCSSAPWLSCMFRLISSKAAHAHIRVIWLWGCPLALKERGHACGWEHWSAL